MTDEATGVRVGLVTAPGAAAGLGGPLAADVRGQLAAAHPGVGWQVEVEQDRLVAPPATGLEVVEAARARLLDRGWDLVVVLTDLPLRVDRRPVVAQASPLHGVAVVSLPALGAVGVRRRTAQLVADLVTTVLGQLRGEDPSRPVGRRLAARAGTDGGVAFTARVATGHVRLLVGMVRANQPWRLALDLSRALTAALAAGVFALITPDVWRLAAALGTPRLVVLTVASLAAVVLTLLLGADLWERPRSARERQQAVLFNLATTATVALGVACLYVALLVLSLLAAALLVPPDLLADGLGSPVGAGDYARLAWLTSSLATAGGALGAGLESDEAVREAAYGREPGPGGVRPPAAAAGRPS